MLFGPIFTYELITTGRRTRFIVLRVLFLVAMLFALWITYENNYYSFRSSIPTLGQRAQIAREFFLFFAWGQLLLILLMGPLLTAGTIAQERDRRTLEYIFASDLRDHEIILGKYAARLMLISYFILAGLPVLQFMSLLGGISPELVLQSYVITISSLVTVAAVGLAVSVRSRNAREAVTSILILTIGFLGGTFFLWVAEQGFRSRYWEWLRLLQTPFVRMNPIVSLFMITEPFVARGKDIWAEIGWMVSMHALITGGTLSWSIWAVRRIHRKSLANRAPLKTRVQKWFQSLPLIRLLFWRPAVWHQSLLWKECFIEKAGGKLGFAARLMEFIIFFGTIGLFTWFFLYELIYPDYYGSSRRAHIEFLGITLSCILCFACVALLLVGARAASLVSSERERDTWITLQSTPSTGMQIIRSKILGNIFALRGPLFLMAYLATLCVIFDPTIIFIVPFFLVTFFSSAWFLSALGILLSVNAKSSGRAIGWTLGILLLLNGGYLLCCIPIFNGPGPGDGVILTFFPITPFLLSVPGIIWEQATSSSSRSFNDEEFSMMIAYIIGTVGYPIASYILTNAAALGIEPEYFLRPSSKNPALSEPAA